jgi:hypothetical protein
VKCIWCKRELQPDDEVVSIEGHGLAHGSAYSEDCANEYYYEFIAGVSFVYSEQDEWDKQFYNEDGFYDDSFLDKPYDIYIDDKYFTTVIAKSETLALHITPLPMKQLEPRMKNGEKISIDVKER